MRSSWLQGKNELSAISHPNIKHVHLVIKKMVSIELMHWWTILWENESKFSTEVQYTAAFKTAFLFISRNVSVPNCLPKIVITSSDFADTWCAFIFFWFFQSTLLTLCTRYKGQPLTIYAVLPSLYTFLASTLKWQTATLSRSLSANPCVHSSVEYSLQAAQESSSPVGPSVYG